MHLSFALSTASGDSDTVQGKLLLRYQGVGDSRQLAHTVKSGPSLRFSELAYLPALHLPLNRQCRPEASCSLVVVDQAGDSELLHGYH